MPGADAHAVELDETAYAWAERNPAGTGVDLRHGDMATAFDDLAGTVDVVTCNPPHVPLEVWSPSRPRRDHDPHLALFSGADGLDAIRVPSAVPRCSCGPGSGGLRARRRVGRVRARGPGGGGALDRRPRPRRPGRSGALHDGQAGTMTAVMAT